MLSSRVAARLEVGGEPLRSQIVGPDAAELPDTLIVLASTPSSAGPAWLIDRAPVGREVPRLAALLGHLARLQRIAGDLSPWWTLVCLRDGWREEGSAEREDSRQELRWNQPDAVLCFGRRLDDASAVLVAEPHFFIYGKYRRLRTKVRLSGLPWAWRRRSAIYAGGDHGRTIVLPGGGSGTPRRLLAQVVAEQGLPVKVALGERISVPEQLLHRVLLDVDGHVRTWEAWAWKMLSGSVVVSQSSPWQTRFTAEFEPGVHYLPSREDFQDLEAVLRWCRGHWSEAREIALRARRRAGEVYSAGWIENADEWRRISVALQPLPRPLAGKRLS